MTAGNRVIPLGERPEWAADAFEYHAVDGDSTRMIAERLFVARGIRVSHVTCAELVHEGRAAHPMPDRAQVRVDLDAALRGMVSRLAADRRTGAATSAETAPPTLAAWRQLARLHGADAPTALVLDDLRAPPTVDAAMAVRLVDVEQASARALAALRTPDPSNEETA